MNEIFIYPAIDTIWSNDDFNVIFVDFDHIITYGENMIEAYLMAEDALALELFDKYEHKEGFPKSTNINNIKLEENQSLILVKASLKEIIKKFDDKAVKKTLTIPSWLNKLALEQKINFSQVLQSALEEKLNK